ncbi:MAG: oligosaccharide flippase family protein [Clostridia bacterium]|nr:oligosaccharide flippase family protein [Clostridia bacterium]
MKKKSVTENVFFNMLYQVLVTVLPFVTTPYIARSLGLSANGVHSFTESIVTYFIIFGAIGTSLYGIRKIAYIRDDEEELARVTKEIISLRLILTVITLAIYVPLLCFNNEYAYIYRIQIINIIANGIDITWFYQGVEDFKKVTIRNLIVKFLYVVCLFIFIKEPSDLPWYVFLIVISSLIGNLIMVYYLPQYVDLRKGKKLNLLSHLKPSFVLFIPQAMNYIYALIDRSMLGWLTNTDNVGLYDQAQRIVRMITAILQSVGYVMMARVANLTMSNDREGIIAYIRKSVNFNLFIAFPAMFGILGVADDFIPFFLGQEYVDVAPILKVLSILVFTTSMNSLMGVQLLIPLGKEKVYTIATAVGAIISVVGNLLLIPKFEIFGSCIAYVVAETAVFVISYWNLRDMFNLGRLLKDNISIIVGSVLMYIVVRIISIFDMNIIVKLLCELMSGASVYFAIAFITKNETFLMILDKVFSFLRGFINKRKVD